MSASMHVRIQVVDAVAFRPNDAQTRCSCQDACDQLITDNYAVRCTIAIVNTTALPPGGVDSDIGLDAHGHTCASSYIADVSKGGECDASNFTANTMCC